MRRAAIALFLALGLAAAAAAGGEALRSTRGLLAQLKAAGRAEARVTTTVQDPIAGRAQTTTGRLALELPRQARLDFAGGESLTLRDDGGDWLQPRARQLVRSGPRSAEAAMRWSALLFESGAGPFRERPLGKNGYEIDAIGPDSLESQRVWLGRDGLPARLELTTAAGETSSVRLGGWRFTRARGRRAFVLSAPEGFEVVELP